jgi:hypothetical protein
MSNDDWTDDIEEILSKVRQNCIDMYKYHLCRYFQYKRILPVFRVPVLILNALNSVFSVGLQPYMEQSLISVLNCLISLIATLINSIEMYMGIQKSMESEMSSSQGFYILSIGIYKMLTLKRENRDINGKQYLMECYNTYSDLVRNSKLIKDPHMLQKDFLQNVHQVMGGIHPPFLQNGGQGGGDSDSGGSIEMSTDYAANGSSLKEVAMNLLSGEPAPNLPLSLPSPPPSTIAHRPVIQPSLVTESTDLERNSSHPTFSLEGSLPPYPFPPLMHRHRPSLTQVPHHQHHTYDPLYSLSRKNIFGIAPKRNSFLEMAGVDLGELPHRERTDSLTDFRVAELPSLLASHHHHHPHPHHHPHFTTPSQSVTSSPETSRHTHRSPPLVTEKLQSQLEHLLQEQPPEPQPPQQQQPPLQPEQQPLPLQQSKEKGVKDIIHEIESSGRLPVVDPNKPKRETSQHL